MDAMDVQSILMDVMFLSITVKATVKLRLLGFKEKVISDSGGSFFSSFLVFQQ